MLRQFTRNNYTKLVNPRQYLRYGIHNTILSEYFGIRTITLPKHEELQKFVDHKSFDSLSEAIVFHENALKKGDNIKGFFTSDQNTLKAAAKILVNNTNEKFLTELLLTPPSLSTNEQRSRTITFSSIANFPQHVDEYHKNKSQTALLTVGGPAALDTAVIASLMNKIKLSKIIHISGPFKESNLAHSALQLHVRHGTALNAESELTGHVLLLPFLIRNIKGCSIEDSLHPDFRKIDLKFSSLTPGKLRIYLGNEFNWFYQMIRYRLGLMTEHDLNRLESAFSQDVLHLIERLSKIPLSSNADRDPSQSISIHVDLTHIGSEETSANNKLIEKTVGIKSEQLSDHEKEFFFGAQNANIIQATRYHNDGSLLMEAQCRKQKILTDHGGINLEQYITHILFAEDELTNGKARLAGVITDNDQFIYASHMHLSPGYKAKFQFDQARTSRFTRNIFNKMENKLNMSSPVSRHRLTVATGTSINALMHNNSHLKKIIAKYGITPQYAVTNSHWTMLAKNETHILMRITGGGNTGLEDYNPAYFLNLIANTERIFGRETLLGIISTYGCPRSINARNSTEFFKAANVLISYGKGGTGNTKRHAEAILALQELGFTNDVLDFLDQHVNYKEQSLSKIATFIHEKCKDMKFLIEDNVHFDRRLGYSHKLSYNEKLAITICLFGVLICFVGTVFTKEDPDMNINDKTFDQ
ncbi:unnamed protein product [Adineta steineri]|uniref:Uncharacterized protein n=1 Tax=Adineta steineri TaxID=433720 RepID=A0A813VID6_9BILA|nr:unnamed protein product [Adineta steineri]CAF1328584.1 unnamed protein product [Adineta steineri]